MNYSRENLDSSVLDIEFLLISVVQGVALTSLALSSVPVITNFQWEYFPYVLSGFLFVLIFWSQAIIHSMSFIDWPLEISHSFLYFLASFTEVILFSQLTNPQKWFFFTIVFYVVAAALYILDWHMIKMRKKKFEKSINSKNLYSHIFNRQKFELSVIVPSGFVFNVLAFILIFSFPGIFILRHWHILIGTAQALSTLALLINVMISFKKRAKLIGKVV